MSNMEDPRVLFAAERTLLAWNRTSLGLIAFGFLVERSGLLVQMLDDAGHGARTAGAAFWLGAAFIVLGALSAIYSSHQYSTVLKTLTPAEFPAGYSARWGMLVNWLVALLGIAIVIAIYPGYSRA